MITHESDMAADARRMVHLRNGLVAAAEP